MGRTVTVRLITPGTEPTVLLPLAAVLNVGAGAAVWHLPKDTAVVERVPINLVAVDGQIAHVRGALAEGDIVVSLGAYKIDPNRPVRVVETVTAPKS
jgi:hypothetical protein